MTGRMHFDYIDDILPINNIDYKFFCRCYVGKYESSGKFFANIQDIVNYIYIEHDALGNNQ